jgi:hypothetical protein
MIKPQICIYGMPGPRTLLILTDSTDVQWPYKTSVLHTGTETVKKYKEYLQADDTQSPIVSEIK